jgi:hypothetical protein
MGLQSALPCSYTESVGGIILSIISKSFNHLILRQLRLMKSGAELPKTQEYTDLGI